MKFFRSLYIANLFYYILLGLAAVYVLSFYIESLRPVADILLAIWITAILWDLLFLYFRKNKVYIHRQYPEKLSNGDPNPFTLQVRSTYPVAVQARILEEFPEQLQVRDQEYRLTLQPRHAHTIDFNLYPKTRGIYAFGYCHVLVRHLGLFERKSTLREKYQIPCYPSFIQMRKYQLLATTDRLMEMGIKRIRKTGMTTEFDHIREYVRGDEYRHMNWRASAKHHKLLVNQYQEEKSQPIYALIDTGRAMRMPFDGMTLLDYAVNASLVLSNAALLKRDRAGMLTFSTEVSNHIPAERRNNTMRKISDKLYGISTQFQETEFGHLYAFAKKNINKRSLLFVYTNFETLDAMNRQLTYLKMLNKSHIVVVVVFKNTELAALSKEIAAKTIDVYNKIIAEKFVFEKLQIIQELIRHGLQTIYTAPEDLSINSINKYLEIKARGLI